MLDYRRSSYSDAGSSSDTEAYMGSSAVRESFAEPTPAQVTTVEIHGQAYRVQKSVSKQFYLDLTFLEDDELISKYALVPYWQASSTPQNSERRKSSISSNSSNSSSSSRSSWP